MVKEALLELFPPDVPRLVRWRLMVSFVCALMLGHLMLACGFVPGFDGFAMADEVDDKIDQAMAPVRAQLGQITSQIAAQDDTITAIRLDQIAARLRELQQQRCAATDHDVIEAIDFDIESRQREYRALAGERYPLPPCEKDRDP